MKFQQIWEDHRKLLYPGCEDGLKKLGITLELLQWKATNGVFDKGFVDELPTTTYEAKQLVCPLELVVQKIHAPYAVHCGIRSGERTLHQSNLISLAKCNFVGQGVADENMQFISSAETGRRN
jgi:hypothetical protein